MAKTVAITGPAAEDLTSCVIVAEGITIKRGKQTAFGPTEITSCSFTANRSLLKTVTWQTLSRTTETITVVVNGSTRFAGWFWRAEEDIFDDRGLVRISLASSGLRAIIEDTRELRYGTRALPAQADAVAFCAIDAGLLAGGQLVDSEKPLTGIVRPFGTSGGNQKLIVDPPNSIPQLRSGDRNVFASDARYAMLPGATVSPPFRLTFTMNASPLAIAAVSAAASLLKIFTDTYTLAISILSSGNMGVIVRNEVTNTALVNVSVAWATETTAPGELWHIVVEVTESGGNVTTIVGARPMSRAEGRLGEIAGTYLVNDTSATPAGGVGAINRIEFGPAAPSIAGGFRPADLIISDLLLQSTAGGAVGSAEFVLALGGLTSSTLTGSWVPYFGLTSQLAAGTYDVLAPTVPSGTGAEQLAAIEEVYRTVVRDSRTADFTVIRTGLDYVPTQVTELALADDYLRGQGSAGEEGVLEVHVPDANYLVTTNPYGAEWQRRRSRKWARVPVHLDSATKRAVDVGASYVSFWTRPGNIFRGRVVGIEEVVTSAMHVADWVIEEWPHEGQIVTDQAVAVSDTLGPLAARVAGTYSGGTSLNVDSTYAYPVPFTVRPSASSRNRLVISLISGTTWTVNVGSSTIVDGLAIGDLVQFDNAAIAF